MTEDVRDIRGDVLVVGGGLAGLFCALKLAPRGATILTGAPLGSGASSAWAQGGIAAAVAEGDTPEAHARDTVAAGAGIVDEALALDMAREAPERIRELLAYGVPFDQDLEGRLMVSREAAHSARRIVRVKGDQAGAAIMAALTAAIRRTPSITVLEGFSAEDLVMNDGRIAGLRARSGEKVVTFATPSIVLATGGIGHLYALTTNPPEARGTGVAIAARAGATIADAEFVQFHPTAIAIGRDPAPLATEALRGEGAILVNNRGELFMRRWHPDAELAPRDVVARGVFAEITAGRHAFLDTRDAIGAAFADRYPTVAAACLSAGIDPARDLIPVAPAEHYHMGGIATDARGRTSIAGLWAAGEVASTGVHGANRLASNSLLEAVVFAARAADDIKSAEEVSGPLPPVARDESLSETSGREAELRKLMTANVGVIRNDAGLAQALAAIAAIEREATSAAPRNAATTALLIAAASWRRHESRGAHFRSDYPKAIPHQARRSTITLAEARSLAGDAARVHSTASASH